MDNHKRLKDTGTLVRDIFVAHPDWNARQIYDRYLVLVGDPKNAVTLNAVQKHVQEFKKRYQKIKDDGLDLPWSLNKTPDLPAEAIAAIFKVKNEMPKWFVLPPSMSEPNPEHYVIYEGNKLTAIPRYLTVSEALWVARLYAVKSLRKSSVLMIAVVVYSLLERLSWLSDTPLDTSEVDEIIGSDKDIKDTLTDYFQRYSHQTWLDLWDDIASSQIKQTKEGE